ncbi:hypothetical protein PDIDSM_8176 [Penicillium digitatum]|nr:hypothetical protein PDIDSM_8176 [Penicillium digitatum]
MAISVPKSCSPTRPAFLDDKDDNPPRQSMWHRLGLRKLWQGRDDHRDTTSGESQDEISPRPSSDNSRAKQDNLTRRLSRKVGVGLPRTTHFNRQSSDLERLTPREPDIRRALSADRRPLSSPKSRSPPPTVGPRKSAPEVQWLGPTPTTTVDDAPEPESEPNDAHEINDISESSNPIPEITTDNFDVTEDDDYSMDLDMELEQRWILNLSMHFRDGSEREKFFVTYAETPNRWRRVTISCDYHDAQPYSLERELKELRYQRDKCARIYESIRESLLAIQFYEGVTNLRLETSDGRLHVHVTEDVNETIPYPPISCIRHLVNAPIIPEDSLHFESHLSGFVYKINMDGRFYIKKEIPGPDTVDEFLYEINALHALKDRPSVIQVEGIVVDEWRGVVKGLLITYAEKGALVDILYEQRGRTSFARRERWAKQIVQGLCEIHESGYVQGDFTLANIVVDADDNAKIIDINRRGCPVGWEPPEIAAMIESNQRISMYIGVKTDLFQLGMTLWALAMEEDEPERQPRPLRLGDDVKIPEYYRQIVAICLSPTPRHRLSAKDLLSKFPPLPEARVSTPIQSLETIANDSRHLPFSNWALPQPSELGQTFPKGMMQQDNHDYPQKEFSGNSHDEMAHPIFSESHDLVKQSTITLAELNGDMGFSSKPSSSSTLNHHESHNHYEYIEFPRHFDDGSSPYHSDSQRPEDTLVFQIRSMGNGFHSHTLEPPVFSNKSNSLETAPMNNQQETPDQPIYNDSRALVSTEITAPPLPEVSISLVESQDQEALNRPFPKPANDEVDLETSALPISPTFRDYAIAHIIISVPLGTTYQPYFPFFWSFYRCTGTTSSPNSLPVQLSTQNGVDQPRTDATTYVKPTLTTPQGSKNSQPFPSRPINPTLARSGPSLELPSAPRVVESSPIEPPKQTHPSSPYANTGVKPKFTEPSPSTSTLASSELPINPTFRSSETSINISSAPSSQGPSPIETPKPDHAVMPRENDITPTSSPKSSRFPSMHISSLRHTGASIGSLGTPFAASPSVFRIGLLRRPWEKPSANYPDLKSASTMSPGSASSIGNSQTLRKPENAILPAKTHPIESQRNEPCGQSSSTMAGINHTQANLLNSNSSLLRSKLPISPAHSNSKAGSTYAEVEMARAVQGPPSSQAKPSISRFSSN